MLGAFAGDRVFLLLLQDLLLLIGRGLYLVLLLFQRLYPGLALFLPGFLLQPGHILVICLQGLCPGFLASGLVHGFLQAGQLRLLLLFLPGFLFSLGLRVDGGDLGIDGFEAVVLIFIDDLQPFFILFVDEGYLGIVGFFQLADLSVLGVL